MELAGEVFAEVSAIVGDGVVATGVIGATVVVDDLEEIAEVAVVVVVMETKENGFL